MRSRMRSWNVLPLAVLLAAPIATIAPLTGCGGELDKDAELGGDVAEVSIDAVAATTIRLERWNTSLSGAAGSSRYFAVAVPRGAQRLIVELDGPSGDADLYVRFNRYPTTGTYAARSDGPSSQERVELRAPSAGTWYIMLRGYAAFSGARLRASTAAPAASPSPTTSPSPTASPSPTPTASPSPSPTAAPTGAAALEDEVLVLVNAVRARGATCGTTAMPAVGPLVMDAALRASARGHSTDMATQDYFSHVGLDGRSFAQRIEDAGFTGGFPRAENIAAGRGTAAGVMDQWMTSEGHCRNIMNGAYRALGVGYAERSTATYRYYWTQNFGG
jgi:uncharacterized protein YkwD